MSEKKDMNTRITEIIKEIKNFDSRLDESGGKKGPKLELTKSVEKKIQKFQKTVDSYQPKPELTKTLSIEEKTQEFKKLIDSYPSNDLLEILEYIYKKTKPLIIKIKPISDIIKKDIKQKLHNIEIYEDEEGNKLVYKVEHLMGVFAIMLDILRPSHS